MLSHYEFCFIFTLILQEYGVVKERGRACKLVMIVRKDKNDESNTVKKEIDNPHTTYSSPNKKIKNFQKRGSSVYYTQYSMCVTPGHTRLTSQMTTRQRISGSKI